MLRFPVATMIRFCHNHGLIQVSNRPQWFTVAGGSRVYVRKMLAGIADARLRSRCAACAAWPARRAWCSHRRRHRALRRGRARLPQRPEPGLLADASAAERAVLGAIRYQPNRAVLHTDTALLPQRRLAWAAWNYERAADGRAGAVAPCACTT